jgi:hypothetical protein
MTTGQRLAEIVGAFCADALSSTVNLNADLDVVLCVLAQALLAAFRTRLGPGYATATPDTLQRRFLDTAGTITTDGDTITVTLSRRAYSPVLRQSDLRAGTTIPGGKTGASASSSASRRGGAIRCMEIGANRAGRANGSTFVTALARLSSPYPASSPDRLVEVHGDVSRSKIGSAS